MGVETEVDFSLKKRKKQSFSRSMSCHSS
uniref:Uncharacterized protein n=1 Tax=Anguilla anguilla TaxID=7936 RepID=A0A0E9S581_ANGAN